MKSSSGLVFKVASEAWEFEQIHRLNYQTFVEEIPQHDMNEDGALVDKFHQENTYLICMDGRELVGMMAIRGKRPFSLDRKLDDLDAYLPEHTSVCEVRLLSVVKRKRQGRIFPGLLLLLWEHCQEQGYDLAVISGTVRQLSLYQRLGFTPFGPLVGAPDAPYQPMHITREAFRRQLKVIMQAMRRPEQAESIVNLLPGPVGVSERVRKVFSQEPVSHRSKGFVEDFQRTKDLLCGLVGSRSVEILVGSGSLATDAAAAQISLLEQPGLILRNGEFGRRLALHAQSFGLGFGTVDADYGEVFGRREIEAALDRDPGTGWLWACHCETSTGILNDIEMLRGLCLERGVKLCLDCISSIGTVPLDLSGAYLATGVSGKAIGAFPGLALVFYNHDAEPAPGRIPRYLDIGLYASSDGVPFTHSSNLLYALEAAADRLLGDPPYERIADISRWLRREIEDLGLDILAPSEHAAPAVLTICLPEDQDSVAVGDAMGEAGYLLSYMSAYLRERNWIQVCIMGECAEKNIAAMVAQLGQCCRQAAEVR